MKKILVNVLILSVIGMCLAGCGTEQKNIEATSETEQTLEADADNENLDDSLKESEEIEESADDEENEETEELAESEDVIETENEIEQIVGSGPNISFETVDINGNQFNNDMLKDSRLVMLNLWEPWCGPCVGEMPELNELYNNYKDDGLLIVGAYTTFDMDDDALEIVNEIGIDYPIIKCNNSIESLEQNYVPATYLLDNNGNIITMEPFAGANSYSGWEAVILNYLN